MTGGLLVAAQLCLIAVLVGLSGAALESPWSVSGLIVSSLWMVWAVWSMPRKTLKVHPSPAEEGELCRNRAYRWVRHPMYGAVLLAALMVAWANEGLLALFCWLGLIAVLWVKSGLEEKSLVEKYPEYEDFKRSTPRWIPFWPMGRDKRWKRGTRWIGRALLALLFMTLGWQVYESQWDAELFDGKTTRNVRAGEAAQLIESIPDLLVLDVRSEWEFAGKRLPGAINISISDPEFEAEFSKSVSGKSSILIYCAGGYRSRKAVARIMRSGVEIPVYHLHRGMLEWP